MESGQKKISWNWFIIDLFDFTSFFFFAWTFLNFLAGYGMGWARADGIQKNIRAAATIVGSTVIVICNSFYFYFFKFLSWGRPSP